MKTAIGDVMRRCYEKGWITTRDGNISIRTGHESIMSSYFYITPTAVVKHHLHPDNIIKVNLKANQPQNVSIEYGMHYRLQKDATKNRAVVHVHPTNTIAAMYAGFDLQLITKDFPEIFRYTKVGPTVAFFQPGSLDLAEKIDEAFRNDDEDRPPDIKRIVYDIVGLANHGVVAVGSNPWDAYEHIERLEHICEIVLKSGVKPSSWRRYFSLGGT